MGETICEVEIKHRSLKNLYEREWKTLQAAVNAEGVREGELRDIAMLELKGGDYLEELRQLPGEIAVQFMRCNEVGELLMVATVSLVKTLVDEGYSPSQLAFKIGWPMAITEAVLRLLHSGCGGTGDSPPQETA